MATEKSVALVKVELPTTPLARVEELRETFRQLEGKVNLVSPVASVDTIPALHGISLRAVRIDPNINQYGQGAEVYKDSRFCETNERALGGVALQKIAAAAGVNILHRERLDDRSDPYYCDIELTVGMRDFDGTWRTVTKAKEIDLRDGAPETLKAEKDSQHKKTGRLVALDPSALADKRRHIQSLCETKAFYRALRTLLFLKQKYTVEELARDFVVPKLVPALDPNDPDQKKALIDMATGADTRLYGPGRSETRSLRDVTPAPALPAAASDPGETSTVPKITDPKTIEIHGTDDVDVALFGDPPAAAPAPAPRVTPDIPEHLCVCPHGCEKEISAELAKFTVERTGRKLCSGCYPWNTAFKIPNHQGIRNMGMGANYANLTGDQAIDAHRAWMADQAKKKGAGR